MSESPLPSILQTTALSEEARVESGSTSDAGALPLRLRAECLEDAPGEPPRVRCLLTAGVDLRAVALKEEGRRRTARLVATFAVSADGSAEPVRSKEPLASISSPGRGCFAIDGWRSRPTRPWLVAFTR